MRGTSMADIGSYNEKLVLQLIRAARATDRSMTSWT